MNTQASFLIAGTSSGSGKTTITLGIMAALKARGMLVQPFKCGPDFIDPTLHSMVTGEISSNLDLRMCGKSFCEKTFSRRMQGKDVGIVEGVMGLFDGGTASSASLALALDIPVVLVVDSRSAAESAAAVVKGFESYLPELSIAGVIFNRVGSKRHRELIEAGMRGKCDTRILGFFPRDQRFEIPDRHLGLFMGDEAPLQDDQLSELAAQIERHIDLDAMLDAGLLSDVFDTAVSVCNPVHCKQKRVKLAVAKDEAFCFYYPDNIEALERAGAEICYFSPVHDRELPTNCNAVYFGGGYPELHAEQLSANKSMLTSVKKFADNKGIIYGECGGFMYLCDSLYDLKKRSWKMSCIFPLHVRMKPRLSRLGYREPRLLSDCFLGFKGDILYGHEFHYSEVVEIPESVATCFQLDNESREGYIQDRVIGSYVHLHFGKSTDALTHFINQISESVVTT